MEKSKCTQVGPDTTIHLLWFRYYQLIHFVDINHILWFNSPDSSGIFINSLECTCYYLLKAIRGVFLLNEGRDSELILGFYYDVLFKKIFSIRDTLPYLRA